jgi:cytochrome c peroxidase
MDPDVAAFGQQLFFDKGLSPGRADGTRVSCADCHSPTEWFSDARPDNNVSQGVGLTARNSPSLVNVAFYQAWGWDGRADSLWGQCHHAYVAPGTMAGTPAALLEAVRARYADRFEAVFHGPLPAADAGVGDPLPTAVDGFYRDILKAWAAYLTQLTSSNAPFDRFAMGEKDALSVEQRRGLRLFVGKAGCIECHQGPSFTDNKYHSVGIGQSGRGVPEFDYGRETGLIQLGKLAFRPEGAMAPSAPAPEDRGLFRTKGLRQVAKTAPYFHAGQLATLKEVVWFYAQGGDHDGFNVSPFLVPLGLTDAEQADLVAFLEALTGDEVPAALRCDNSRPGALPAGATASPFGASAQCPFGGLTVTQSMDGGVSVVCNAASPVTRCAVIP